MKFILSKVKSLLSRVLSEADNAAETSEYGLIKNLSVSDVLKNFNETLDPVFIQHPFWSQPDFLQKLDTKTLENLLKFISAASLNDGDMYRLHTETTTQTVSRKPSWQGAKWSTPKQFHKFQKHILEERSNEEKVQLLPWLHDMLVMTMDYTGHWTDWLINADHFLAHGGQFEWKSLAAIMYHNEITWKIPASEISSLTHLLQEFNTKASDTLIIDFCTSGPGARNEECTPTEWLFKTHPQANAWVYADNEKMKFERDTLAQCVPDGPIFKAWHGLPLTTKDVAEEPLSELLYIHKHLGYTFGRLELPPAWTAALALAHTGAQFKEMISLPQHSKQTSLELPDLSI